MIEIRASVSCVLLFCHIIFPYVLPHKSMVSGFQSAIKGDECLCVGLAQRRALSHGVNITEYIYLPEYILFPCTYRYVYMCGLVNINSTVQNFFKRQMRRENLITQSSLLKWIPFRANFRSTYKLHPFSSVLFTQLILLERDINVKDFPFLSQQCNSIDFRSTSEHLLYTIPASSIITLINSIICIIRKETHVLLTFVDNEIPGIEFLPQKISDKIFFFFLSSDVSRS